MLTSECWSVQMFGFEKCKDCGWLGCDMNTFKPISCLLNIEPENCNDVLILNKTMIRRTVKKK